MTWKTRVFAGIFQPALERSRRFFEGVEAMLEVSGRFAGFAGHAGRRCWKAAGEELEGSPRVYISGASSPRVEKFSVSTGR